MFFKTFNTNPLAIFVSMINHFFITMYTSVVCNANDLASSVPLLNH